MRIGSGLAMVMVACVVAGCGTDPAREAANLADQGCRAAAGPNKVLEWNILDEEQEAGKAADLFAQAAAADPAWVELQENYLGFAQTMVDEERYRFARGVLTACQRAKVATE